MVAVFTVVICLVVFEMFSKNNARLDAAPGDMEIGAAKDVPMELNGRVLEIMWDSKPCWQLKYSPRSFMFSHSTEESRNTSVTLTAVSAHL